MRAAPAFALQFELGLAERCVSAAIGGFCAAATAAWAWSFVDAAAGLAGRGLWPWVSISMICGGVGTLAAWLLTRGAAGTIAWQQGEWSLARQRAAQTAPGSLVPMVDLGSWMLLRFRPHAGGRPCWCAIGRRSAGAAWHALRATLYAPGAASRPKSASEARSYEPR